jgi:hypothetical protein
MTPRPAHAVIVQFAVATAGLLSACGLSAKEDRTIEAWLNCDECVHGERAAVRALGQDAVPTLERALRQGPPQERLAIMNQKARSIHRSLDTAARVPVQIYVSQLERNYVANYQKRAAVALADLGGDRARNALQDALAPRRITAYRADVVSAIRAAQASVDADRFLGSIEPLAPRFGDTVIVRPTAAEPFNGNELPELDGSPFPALDVRLFARPDALAFIAVAPAGPRALTLRNVGRTTRSQHATVILRTMLDVTDRRTTSCADIGCQIDRAPRLAAASLPYETFLSLWRIPPSDTMDVVAIQSAGAAPLAVTAELDWHSTANLDMRWMDCRSRSLVGPTDGATTAPRERTSAAIPGARCWALVALLASRDTVPVIARLRIRSP